MTTPQITTAELAGGDGQTEDRVFATRDFVVVLDGVSSLRTDGPRSGWYSEALGNAIVEILTECPGVTLRDAVVQSITKVAADHDLVPGASPASTVAISRWAEDHLEGLVLGDSPIVVYRMDGRIEVFHDARHDAVVAELRRTERNKNGWKARDADQIQALIRATRPAKLERMNRDDGYWIAEATPLAGRRALIRRWPLNEIAAALVVTDGVSCGIDSYATPPSWSAALDLALSDGLEDLLRIVHKAEASDPHAHRWPRGKRHDDKAAALVVFAAHLTEAAQ